MHKYHDRFGPLTHRPQNSAYEGDYYAWTVEQAARLRRLASAGEVPGGESLSALMRIIDWRNLAEEVEDLGISQRNALESHLENLLIHLLKWRYQAKKRGGSWQASVINPRRRIERVLKESPSLKPYLPEALAYAYENARAEAGSQMQMDQREWEARLPAECEWTLEQVLDAKFWPEEAPEWHSW